MATKDPNSTFEEIKLKGSQVVEKIRDLIDEGSARRVIVKKEDRILMELPLTAGVGGAAAAILLAPQLAALGALAALVTDVELIIEHKEEPVTELPSEMDPPETGS